MVEKLIKGGHLRRYILDTVRRAEVALAVERIAVSIELPSEPRPIINYILGSLTDNHYQFKHQKKRLLCAATVRAGINTIHTLDNSRAVQSIDGPISFPSVNLSKVIIPHHDALVLTLCINDFDVHRVLVDPGNATDLLQLPAFRQMRISLDMLSSVGRILSGFNRATTVIMGDIALPVKAGPVVQQFLFSIVEDLGQYNAIVGRARLHAMKVMPSTYHQMIGYTISVGQIGLLSSQLAARQCYQLLVQKHEKNESSHNRALEAQTVE